MNRKSLIKIEKILTRSQIIALPTETVYGLAGNAYSNSAVKKIYKIKKRPKKNPVILHYYNLSIAKNDFYYDKTFLKLYKKFCPGPITFIVRRKKNSRISKLKQNFAQKLKVLEPFSDFQPISLDRLCFLEHGKGSQCGSKF